MLRISLRDAVRNRHALSKEQVEGFKTLLLKGMRSPKRKDIINNLTPKDIYSFADEWFGTRIMFTSINQVGCYYVAGQYYPAEISSIRDTIIKKYS